MGKDFFGNPIKRPEPKLNASYPTRAISICKIFLIGLTFLWVHTLRPSPDVVYDLVLRINGEIRVFKSAYKTKDACEDEMRFQGLKGIRMECVKRVTK